MSRTDLFRSLDLIEPGDLVRYHGSIAAAHGLYLAAPCSCPVCDIRLRLTPDDTLNRLQLTEPARRQTAGRVHRQGEDHDHQHFRRPRPLPPPLGQRVRPGRLPDRHLHRAPGRPHAHRVPAASADRTHGLQVQRPPGQRERWMPASGVLEAASWLHGYYTVLARACD
ncbi:hypothetical protein [Streptomyces triculaminicus]|uniref:hypothetical protein n=1 Tax=Streptomyces triculaminicus TaxID=2816232 RepID=UPI0037AD2339